MAMNISTKPIAKDRADLLKRVDELEAEYQAGYGARTQYEKVCGRLRMAKIRINDFRKRVDELEQCTRLACNLYGHTNLENEYEGSTFLRCGVCGKNFDDQ
jgi:hypothetical protein